MADRQKRFGTIVPWLHVSDARKAIEWYKRAFGARATEKFSESPFPGDSRIMYAELELGPHRVLLGDYFDHCSAKRSDPQTLGGTSCEFFLQLVGAGDAVDQLFAHVVRLGAQVLYPCEDQFWGSRMAKVRCPFGHVFVITAELKDPERLNRAKAKFDQELRCLSKKRKACEGVCVDPRAAHAPLNEQQQQPRQKQQGKEQQQQPPNADHLVQRQKHPDHQLMVIDDGHDSDAPGVAVSAAVDPRPGAKRLKQ